MIERARLLCLLAASLAAALPAFAEYRMAAGAPAVKHQIERLRVLGRVLMIAAHPDDENTALLAWCAQSRKFKTGYLSLTRGEGGQNLIGDEQGDLLGVIRTQELQAARRIDGAEQFFSRAIDFGFSKTADETIAKWGRDSVLADTVWVIRSFRPDVVILRFSGTSRDGHGHHQASSLIGQQAFKLAADPAAFPDQLAFVKPWQPKRILWNGFSFTRQQEQELDKTPDRLMVDTGQYSPSLGMSYGELAGLSRSQHRSQGFGSAERRGSLPNYLFHYGGDRAQSDLMDGVDASWRRLPGGDAIDRALVSALDAFTLDAPHRAIPHLVEARRLIASIDHPDARAKLADLDECLAQAAGLWLDVTAAAPQSAPGAQLRLTLTAVKRADLQADLLGVTLEGIDGAPTFPAATLAFNQPHTAQATLTVPASQPLSQPIQLRLPRTGNSYQLASQHEVGLAEAPPALQARFRLNIGGATIEVLRPVVNRYVDRVRGELTRPFVIVPPVSLEVSETPLLFTSAKPRTVAVHVSAAAKAAGTVSLNAPPLWRVEPASLPFDLAEPGQSTALSFTVTPPQAASRGSLTAVAASAGAQWSSSVARIAYEHIPPQSVFRPAATAAIRADVANRAAKVGYIMGAGDKVPDALRELGCEVHLLTSTDLASSDLSRFDAIVAGVRAFNVRDDLRAARTRILAYMENGGAFIVQYNTVDGGGPVAADPSTLRWLGPYSIKLGRDRTTVEEAPVKFLLPDHRLLQSPNHITPADFDNWVQERALYFPSEWDARYQAPLETADPGEKPQQGGLLYAPIGKGAFIHTSYVWFRELPAGVPGAFKLLANFVSAAK